MRELDARRDPAGRFSDERGHLLASTLGGPQHRLNIAPQVCSVNRCYPSNTFSFWRKIEQEIRTSIDSGRVRHIDWTLVINYDNLQRNDMRPTGFGLRYITHFNNGRACDSSDLYISNEAGSCTLSPTYENVPRRTLTRSQSAPNIYELCGERRRGTKRKHSPDKWWPSDIYIYSLRVRIFYWNFTSFDLIKINWRSTISRDNIFFSERILLLFYYYNWINESRIKNTFLSHFWFACWRLTSHIKQHMRPNKHLNGWRETTVAFKEFSYLREKNPLSALRPPNYIVEL